MSSQSTAEGTYNVGCLKRALTCDGGDLVRAAIDGDGFVERTSCLAILESDSDVGRHIAVYES